MKRISMKNSAELKTIQQAFDGFIKKCQLRNLSKDTISYYQESFRYLTKTIMPDNIVSSLSESVVEDLIFELKKTMKETSINTRLRGIRVFVNYCSELGYITPFKVKLLKTDEEIKATYTTEELKILLERPNIKKCSFTEFRTWTAISVLIGTGCRIGSLLNLKIKDLLFDESMIRFTKTKGRKQLLVPMTKALHDTLKLYLEYRGGEPDDYLICDQWGKQIQRNGLIHAIAKYNQRKGITKTSCHLFRHTFAKHWIQSNGDIFRLQKILGHEDIMITQQYLRDFGQGDLKESFEKFNPLECIARGKSKDYIKL